MAVRALFREPPLNEHDLERRLKPLDPAGARRALVDTLDRGEVSGHLRGLFDASLQLLGVGKEGPRLAAIALDPKKSTRSRAYALEALARLDPALFEPTVGQLSPEESRHLSETTPVDLLVQIQVEPEEAEALASVFEAAPPEARAGLLERLDELRQQVGTPAHTAYAGLFTRPKLGALYERALTAIVAEGGPFSLAFLEERFGSAQEPASKKALQRALMRLRTRNIEGAPRPPRRGFAWCGTCDGQGAFLLLWAIVHPNGLHTAANLCIRASADIRDGFVIVEQSEDSVRDLVAEIEQSHSSRLFSVPLEEAASLAHAAVERTRAAGLDISADAQAALALLDTVPVRAPRVPSPGPVTLEQTRELLERPELRYWFFDTGDLLLTKLAPPEEGQEEDWIPLAANAFASTPIGKRLIAMAKHHALLHAWAGQEELAAQFAGLAKLTEERLETSPLVEIMLERSLERDPDDEETEEDAMEAEGPEARQRLRERFFTDIVRPRGRDVARLDFTARLVLLFERLFQQTLTERPRISAMEDVSYALAGVLVDALVGRRSFADERVRREIERVLQEHLKGAANELDVLTTLTLSSMADYHETVCGECPIQCLKTPAAQMSEVFFSSQHPLDQV